MYRDPVVAEVRRVRNAMVREAEDDLDKYLAIIRVAQEQYEDRLVDELPRQGTRGRPVTP